MSKSAIKALTAAQAIIAEAGVTVNLVGYIADKDVRKNWRNADALAALIINSAGNAFQTENSETFADNYFDDMADAVESYIVANLDDWNQKSAADLNLNVSIETERLEGMVAANMNFEERVSAAYAKKNDAEKASVQAHFWGGMDYSARRDAVEAAHEEALAINAAYSAQLGFYSHTAGWQRNIIMWAHEDALKMDADFERAQAEEGTGTIAPLVLDHAPTVKLHTSAAGRLQLFWDTLNEYQKAFLLGVAHDQALEIDAGLASLGDFRLACPTKEEIEAEYFRSLTDTELAYALEPNVVPEYRRPMYVAEAERRGLQGARKVALNELVSGASLEQARAQFVSRLTTKQLNDALSNVGLPADRRPAYAAELERRQTQAEPGSSLDGFRSRCVLWRKN